MTENFAATPAFDTLKFVKDLTDAGVENTHAHAIAESLNKVLLDILKTAADRADVEKRLEKLEWKWWNRPIFIAISAAVVGAIVSALIAAFLP